MVYFVRAKSYFRYATDILNELKVEKTPEAIIKKAQEVFKLGLKAVWAISQVTPPEKPPTLEDILNSTLPSFESFSNRVLEIKKQLFEKKVPPEEAKALAEEFLKIVETVLSPIL